MNDDGTRLGIAARWGYRSYESETGNRYRLLCDLLRELYANSHRPPTMMALESWDVTRRDFESRFDVGTPILYTDESQVEVFRTIALVRALNDRIAELDPDWGQRHSLSFMHFILGNAAKKHAFIIDLAGTLEIDGHEVAKVDGDGSPPVIRVRLPGGRLDELRKKHSRLSIGLGDILERIPSGAVRATNDSTGIARLSELVVPIPKLVDPEEKATYDSRCDSLIPLLRDLQSDIDTDLDRLAPAVKMAELVSERDYLPATDPLVDLSTSFLRQAFLQAVLVPGMDDCPVAIIVPDMSHKVSPSGRDMGTDVPGGTESSSLAVQFFPRGEMRTDDPDFSFWATLISIVGRGKTVHDFSLLEWERGHENALKETIHRLKTDLSNLLTRLHPPILTGEDLAPLSPGVLRNLEIVRQRLRLEVIKVQALYVRDRGRSAIRQTLAAGELIGTYDLWRQQLVEENSQNPLFQRVPSIDLRLPADTVCTTIPARFEDVCLELIVNLVRHIDWHADVPPCLSLKTDGRILFVESEHCCREDSLRGLRKAAGQRGTARISGMYTIEFFQDMLGLPIWSYSVADAQTQRIRVVYPIAHDETGGKADE